MKGNLHEIMMSFSDALEPGESQRVSHTDCPAGEDTRERVYVSRKSDVLLAYCHNCGKSSSKYMAADDRYRHGSSANIRKPATSYTDPTLVLFGDKENIPAEADAWRLKGKLSRNIAQEYGFQYAPEWDSIYVPFYDMETEIAGHQLRPLHRRGGAKYINFVKDKDKELGGITVCPHKRSKTIVIVEDLVSAAHINGAGYDALINYGTHVKPTILYKIPKDYKQVVVWLDNDNPTVHEHAKQMFDILHLYNNTGQSIRRISKHEDPKHYDDVKIKEIIDDGRIRP